MEIHGKFYRALFTHSDVEWSSWGHLGSCLILWKCRPTVKANAWIVLNGYVKSMLNILPGRPVSGHVGPF